MEESDQSQFEAAALLRNPLRRALFDYVTRQGREVGRDEAAAAAGAGREAVASHLDKLAEAGLLEVSFRRLGERQGPGAGRPAKLYRPSGHAVEVALPPRRYEVLAELFATVLEESDSSKAALDQVAARLGQSDGRRARRSLPASAGRPRALAALESTLREYGFEPGRKRHEIALMNCPFRALSDRHTELVCGLNLALVAGLIEGLGVGGVEAQPVSPNGRCCVVVRLRRDGARRQQRGP
ncbi:MAG: transcriptional regulator [Actinomycetota bacterium]|nr:transcriptional regulator [Actinomycetota bacterium]